MGDAGQAVEPAEERRGAPENPVLLPGEPPAWERAVCCRPVVLVLVLPKAMPPPDPNARAAALAHRVDDGKPLVVDQRQFPNLGRGALPGKRDSWVPPVAGGPARLAEFGSGPMISLGGAPCGPPGSASSPHCAESEGKPSCRIQSCREKHWTRCSVSPTRSCAGWPPAYGGTTPA